MFMHRNLRNVLAIVALLIGVVICSHSTALAQPTRAPLFAVLLGANEISATGQANAGDLNGNGSATVIIDGSTTLCFAVIVNGIGTPTNMHIHDGVAGVNGPVVVPLGPPFPATGNPGTSSGCVPVGAALLNSIRNSSSRFYVNVHTTAFPGGAIRGQLF